MHLVVHIPYHIDEESSRALSLARQAPSFTMEWVDNQRIAISIFPLVADGNGFGSSARG